jgi:hypothetical protein
VEDEVALGELVHRPGEVRAQPIGLQSCQRLGKGCKVPQPGPPAVGYLHHLADSSDRNTTAAATLDTLTPSHDRRRM